MNVKVPQSGEEDDDVGLILNIKSNWNNIIFKVRSVMGVGCRSTDSPHFSEQIIYVGSLSFYKY